MGEPVETTALYHRDDDGVCRPSEPTTAALYRLEPMDLASFVTAELLEGTGGRLALDWAMAEDGATQAVGLRDTMRGERCAPYGIDSSGRGAERVPCVPGEVSQAMTTGGARCDQTWAISSDECTRPADYAVRQTGVACGRATAIEVFRAVAPVPEDELVFGEDCTGFELERAVTVEPANDSVPWLTREVRGAGRVQRMVWTDGALEIAAVLYDSELETTCAARPTADGDLRCLPREAHRLPDGERRRFIDEACTTPGYPERGLFCRSEWVVEREPACGSYAEAVYRIAAPAARGYRIDEDGACVPVEDEIVHRLELVPLTDFARIERVTE